MMAVLTVMYMAANFGKKELGLKDEVLIPTILIIQLVGVVGSIGFARLSHRIGNINAMMISVVVWIGICIGAYFVSDSKGFMLLACFVGLVMGGIQALARSTYSKLLPKTNEHTAYFSFYDVAEKMAVVLGTFLFGLLETLTGSMRSSILLLGVLFLVGLIFLIQLKKINSNKLINAGSTLK
jgi:UMF1 family MFS transporter